MSHPKAHRPDAPPVDAGSPRRPPARRKAFLSSHAPVRIRRFWAHGSKHPIGWRLKKPPQECNVFGVQAKTYLFNCRQINENEMENDEILRYEVIFATAGANIQWCGSLTPTSLVRRRGEKVYQYIYMYIYICIYIYVYVFIYIYIHRYHKNNT